MLPSYLSTALAVGLGAIHIAAQASTELTWISEDASLPKVV